jgi:hypothetical protein
VPAIWLSVVNAVQVIKDLKLLGELLHKRLTKFQQVSGEKDHRIVVFIDDLDRCKPSSIIEVGDISMRSTLWYMLEVTNPVATSVTSRLRPSLTVQAPNGRAFATCRCWRQSTWCLRTLASRW